MEGRSSWSDKIIGKNRKNKLLIILKSIAENNIIVRNIL